jgi:hypothetical protein
MVLADMPPNFFDIFLYQDAAGGGALNDDDLTEFTRSLWMGCA